MGSRPIRSASWSSRAARFSGKLNISAIHLKRVLGDRVGSNRWKRSGAFRRNFKTLNPSGILGEGILPQRTMTAFGTKQASRDVRHLSAFGGKADMPRASE